MTAPQLPRTSREGVSPRPDLLDVGEAGQHAPQMSFTVDLGSVPVGVTAPEPVGGWLRARLAPFLTDPSEPGWEVRVEVTGPTPAFLDSPRAVFPERVAVEAETRGFLFDGATVAGRVDLRERRMEVRGPLAAYPFDIALRHLLPSLVPDALVVHSASLVLGGRATLCAGDSGCGKSTLARLADDRALCDELSLVVRSGDGFRVVALPYWVARPGEAPLDQVLMLEHGADNRLEELPREVAVKALSRQLLWPVGEPARMAETLDLLGDLVDAVPVRSLAFRPDREVIRCLEGGCA